jgi:DNA-binding MarR family transcriptional regulator
MLIWTPVDGELIENAVQQIVCATEHLEHKSSLKPLIEGRVGHMSVGSLPGRGPGREGVLRDDLGWALGVVFRSYVKAAGAAFADLPGGPRGYQVLAAAVRGQLASQLALAQHLGVDRTVMTYLLDDLEQARLIERHPDPADRRARRIVATMAGRELLDELDRRLRAAECEVLAGLENEADRGTFRALLRQLAGRARELDAEPGPCEIAQQISPAAALGAASPGGS